LMHRMKSNIKLKERVTIFLELLLEMSFFNIILGIFDPH